MVTKTSREIIRNAKTLANADNSDFTDFFLNTTLLNNAYREAYDILTMNSLSFIDRIEVTEDTILPWDCYCIISVEDRNGMPIQQNSLVGNDGSGWSVENGKFIYPKNRANKASALVITYSTIPATLTAPDKIIRIEDPTPEDYDVNYPYRVEYDGTTYSMTKSTKPQLFMGGELDWDISNQTFTWKGLDFYDYISRQDDNGNDIPFKNVQVHSPYMAITYDDNKLFIFTGWRGTEYNYDCIFGHETFCEAIAMTTDDTTGYGLIIKKEGSFYYAPFVPDTILSYPNNTLFAFLEYRIAFQIASLLNVNVDFITKELTRAEDNFYKNIGYSNNVHRMNNFNTRGTVIV